MPIQASYFNNARSLIGLIPSISFGARLVNRLAKGETQARRNEIALQLGYALARDGELYGGLIHRGRALPIRSISVVPRVTQFIPTLGSGLGIDAEPIFDALVHTRTNHQSKFSFPRVTPRGLWLGLGLLIRPAKLHTTLQELEAKYDPKEAAPGSELFDLQGRVQGLLQQVADRYKEVLRLEEEVKSGQRVVDFMQQITQMIVRGVPDDEFIHSLCEILFRAAGLKRCVAFLYDPVKEALVAEAVPEQATPWASEEPEHTAEIEAFTSGSLVVPLTPEGQKDMAKSMIARATKLSLNPFSPPGSSVARRIFTGLPHMVRGKMVKPSPTLLSFEEQPVWDRLGLEMAYGILNVESISRGWNRYYSGEGEDLTLEFSKDISIGGTVKRVVLRRERAANIAWEEYGVDEALRDELLAGNYPEVLQRLLDIWTTKDFHDQADQLETWLAHPVEIDTQVRPLGLTEWSEIFSEAESIITRVYKQGRTLVVNDTSNPEHPVSKILIRMWGSRTFIASPIKIFALVLDEEGEGYRMEERVIGVFGMDHDQQPRHITPEVQRRVDLLINIASIGFTLRSYTQALETALGKHLGPRVTEEIISKMLTGRQTELAPQPAECSVMFTDIVGFTGITQRLKTLGVSYLADFLTEYRQWLDGHIFTHEGVLDKYVGDAHVAAWGTPVAKHEDDAARSLQAAVVMQREADRFMKETRWGRIFQDLGLSPLQIRIGIDTGEVMAGILSSGHKEEYTVVGDSVNCANRLEGAAGPSGILISESTFNQLGPDFLDRYVQEINPTVWSWFLADSSPELRSMDWSGFTVDDLFKRRQVQIDIGGEPVDVWAYQVEWDRKKLKDIVFDHFWDTPD